MDKLEKVILEMTDLFKQAKPLEQEKLNAAASNQVTFVEDCMKREQALLLKIRGLDQKRESVLKELGYQGKTFREIIDMQEGKEKEKLCALFEDFSKAIKEFSSINEEALKIIKVNLHQIDKVLGTQQAGSDVHITDKRV